MKHGKNISYKPRRKRVTWTFQPDDDVVDAVARLNGGRELDRGERTELIKRALTFQYPHAFRAAVKKRLLDATEEMAELERRLHGEQPSSQSDQDRRSLVKLVEDDSDQRAGNKKR